MKAFNTIAFDLLQSEKEVSQFDQLLQKHPSLKEKRDILPFFRWASPRLVESQLRV